MNALWRRTLLRLLVRVYRRNRARTLLRRAFLLALPRMLLRVHRWNRARNLLRWALLWTRTRTLWRRTLLRTPRRRALLRTPWRRTLLRTRTRTLLRWGLWRPLLWPRTRTRTRTLLRWTHLRRPVRVRWQILPWSRVTGKWAANRTWAGWPGGTLARASGTLGRSVTSRTGTGGSRTWPAPQGLQRS